MDLPYSWLWELGKDWPDVEDVGRDLSRLGYEVAEVSAWEAGLAPVVLALVVDRKPHPASHRLALVTVEIGEGHTVTVVTGATNGVAGDRVWYGPPGTVLPDGRRLETIDIHGVPSPGMLLSAAECGYRASPGDLWIWEGHEAAGTPWPDIMGRDWVLRLELTPNLAQFGQSAIGVARDLAGLYGLPQPVLPKPPLPGVGASGKVVLEASELCPIYSLMAVETTAGQLPWTWQRRLVASGFRLISPVVDVTNYVLMELGQPLHAFDADRVALPICVRLARPGEELVLLDGTRLSLGSDDLVIADVDKVLALAGIMGGQDSGVGPHTRRVLLESAHFKGPGIYRSARRLGLNTDAALRFSRGTDPGAAEAALARAEAALAQSRSLIHRDWVVTAGEAPTPRRVGWNPDRIRVWLGTDWDDARLERDLGRLGFHRDRDHIVVPSYRPDIEGLPDLAEEIVRLEGMDAIPVRLPAQTGIAKLDRQMVEADRVRDLMVAAGFTEVLTRSFIAPGILADLGFPEGVHRLRNPLREEESVLRSSLLPSLLTVSRYNHDRQWPSEAIFEVGRVFQGRAEDPVEHLELGVLLTLEPLPALYGAKNPSVYDLKGLIELMAETMGWPLALASEPGAPYLHPGRFLSICYAGTVLGHLGEVHPTVAAQWHLPRTGVVILRLPPPGLRTSKAYDRPSRFPGIRRDLSLLVREGTTWQAIDRALAGTAAIHLRHWEPFDQYFGPLGRSVGVSLHFQADDRTLTESDVDEEVARLLQVLSKIGVERRE